MSANSPKDQFEFDYDPENDDLFIFNKNLKSKSSVEYSQDIILDLGAKNKIVAVELINVSELFSKLTDKRITKKDMQNLMRAKFKLEPIKHQLALKIYIFFLKKIEKEKAVIPITLPSKAKERAFFPSA